MTVTVQYLHTVLQAAETREDLAVTYKVFREVSKVFDADWQPIEEAFKLRAEEMGLKWKQ